MHFGFALELSNVDLLNIDLLDTHLDLLDTDILSKYFACLHNVFKVSSRYVFKTSWRHVLKTFSRRIFKTSSRRIFKTSSRRLQGNSSLSSKTSWGRLARCLEDILEDLKLLRWRRVEDVFKTNKCLLGCNMRKPWHFLFYFSLLQFLYFNFNRFFSHLCPNSTVGFHCLFWNCKRLSLKLSGYFL